MLLIFNKSVLPIFFIIFLAFIYHLLYRPEIKPLANLALALFAPVMIFDSLTRYAVQFSDLALPFAFMLLLTAALLTISYLLAWPLGLNAQERTSYVMGASMINVGYFGLPLIQLTYGEQAVALSIVYFVIFNIPVCTLAIFLSSDKTRIKDILQDVLRIPIFYALVLALLSNWLGIAVPDSLQQSLQLISAATIPLLIFILGLQLASISLVSLRSALPRFALIVGSATGIRLAASPFAAVCLLALLQVQGLERSVAVLQTSSPAAILPLMYAIRFNRSPQLLAAIILFSTLLSGISLPFIIQLL